MVFKCTFSYIVAVSFISGGNRSIQRKPLKSLKYNKIQHKYLIDKYFYCMFYHKH